VRWAGGRAALSFHNPWPTSLSLNATLELVGPAGGAVALWRDGVSLGQVTLGSAPARLVVEGVEMAPGINVFHLDSSGPASRGPGGRGSLRAFGLLRSSVGPPGMPMVADN
jgi:hypothetical protein